MTLLGIAPSGMGKEKETCAWSVHLGFATLSKVDLGKPSSSRSLVSPLGSHRPASASVPHARGTVSCDLLYTRCFYVRPHKRLSILMAGAVSSLFLIFLVPNAVISPRWGQHSLPSPSHSLTLGPYLISSSLHLIYIMGRGRARAGPRGLLLQLQSLPS